MSYCFVENFTKGKTYNSPFSSVSIINLEQVNVSWELIEMQSGSKARKSSGGLFSKGQCFHHFINLIDILILSDNAYVLTHKLKT